MGLTRKRAIETNETFDFLKEIVEKVADPAAGGDARGAKRRKRETPKKEEAADGEEAADTAPAEPAPPASDADADANADGGANADAGAGAPPSK